MEWVFLIIHLHLLRLKAIALKSRANRTQLLTLPFNIGGLSSKTTTMLQQIRELSNSIHSKLTHGAIPSCLPNLMRLHQCM